MPDEIGRASEFGEDCTVSSSGLEEALAKARDTLASGLLANEAGVQAAVIRPILRELGWDDADPQQWQVEYQVDSGRVDEALLGPGGQPLVFIEAKRQGNLNVKAEDQLFGYAANKGVPVLVLTDGDTWDLYLSMAAGEPAERRFAHLTLTESDDLDRVAQDLREFIEREAVLSGRADDAAKARLKQVKDREIGKSGLESAWAELLREPDDMLRDLLIEKVEQRIGARPAADDAERFLRSQTMRRVEAAPKPTPPDDRTDATQRTAAERGGPPPPGAKLRGFEFRGERYMARHAKVVMALLADTLAEVDPEFLQRWSHLGRGRMHRSAIRTGDPLLSDPKRRTWYVQLPSHSDWHVFTGVNQTLKLGMMQDMAEAAGLVRDRDVRPILG